MIFTAAICVLVYYVFYFFEMNIAWQMARPIVICPIMGLVLGDFKNGIILGGMLESVFMGISAIGGSAPAECFVTSILCTAFVIKTGASLEAAIAIALPVGTVISSVGALIQPIMTLFAPKFEQLAKEGETKKYDLLLWGVTFGISPVNNAIILFFSIAFGIGQLESLMAMLPVDVMRGITAASSMLPIIGLAILTITLWSKEVGAFLLLGFILNKYLGLSTLPIALLGLIIALVSFFNEKKMKDLVDQSRGDIHE